MIDDIIAKTDLHRKRLNLALKEIKEWDNIDSLTFITPINLK